MTVYGYVRVSTKEQNEDRQLDALSELNVKGMKIYTDKQSGKDFNRPQYQEMVKRMKKGDLLYVPSIDRLGRNYEDIKEQWRYLTKEIGIDICILDSKALLDTRASMDSCGNLISDLTLSILSFFADNERKNIRKRQAEGIAAAKARGVHLGRRPNPVPKNFPETVERWKNGEIQFSEALSICKMKPATFYRRIKDLNSKK